MSTGDSLVEDPLQRFAVALNVGVALAYVGAFLPRLVIDATPNFALGPPHPPTTLLALVVGVAAVAIGWGQDVEPADAAVAGAIGYAGAAVVVFVVGVFLSLLNDFQPDVVGMAIEALRAALVAGVTAYVLEEYLPVGLPIASRTRSTANPSGRESGRT